MKGTLMVHPKVKAGSAAAAVSGVIVWLLGKYVLKGQVDPAVTAEIYAVVPALLTFLAGYLTPARKAPAAASTLPPGAPASVPPMTSLPPAASQDPMNRPGQ